MPRIARGRTPSGQARSSQNARSHGMRSLVPIIPGVETEEEWQTHRQSIISALAPAGGVETRLAERAAFLFWRLDRIQRYETQLVAAADPPDDTTDLEEADDPDGDQDNWGGMYRQQDEYARQVAPLFDRVLLGDDAAPVDADDALAVVDAVRVRFTGFKLDQFAVPDQPGVPLTEHKKWTAGLVRRVISAICQRVGKDPAHELRYAVFYYRECVERGIRTMADADARRDDSPAPTSIPAADLLDRLTRYEAHISRQLLATLHELEAFQDRRTGKHTPLGRIEVNGELPPPIEKNMKTAKRTSPAR